MLLPFIISNHPLPELSKYYDLTPNSSLENINTSKNGGTEALKHPHFLQIHQKTSKNFRDPCCLQKNTYFSVVVENFPYFFSRSTLFLPRSQPVWPFFSPSFSHQTTLVSCTCTSIFFPISDFSFQLLEEIFHCRSRRKGWLFQSACIERASES